MSTNYLIDTNEKNSFNFQSSIDDSDSDSDSDGNMENSIDRNINNLEETPTNSRFNIFSPEIIKKRILVDTYQLNKNSNFNSSDYEFNLYSSNQQETGNFNRTGGLGLYRNVIGFKLLDCVIENTTFTINNSNNEFSYFITGQLDDILISRLNNKINTNRLSRTIFEEPEIINNLTEYVVILNNGIYDLNNINDCIPRDTAGIVIGNRTGRILPIIPSVITDETIPSPSLEDISEFLKGKGEYYSLPQRVEYNNMVDINIYYDDNEKRIIVRSPLSILPYWNKNQQTRGFAQTLGFYNNIDQLQRIGFNGRDNNRIFGENAIPENIRNPVKETINQINNSIKLDKYIIENIGEGANTTDNITICNRLPCSVSVIDHINLNSNSIPFLSEPESKIDTTSNINIVSDIYKYIKTFNDIVLDASLCDNATTFISSTFKSNLEVRLVCINKIIDSSIDDSDSDDEDDDEGDEDPNQKLRNRYECNDYEYYELNRSEKIKFNRRYFDIPRIDYQKTNDLINLIPSCYYMESPSSNIQGPEPILSRAEDNNRNERIFKLYDYKLNVCESSDQDSNYKTTYILVWTNPPQTEITPLISKNQYRCGIIADQIPHLDNSYIDLVIDEIPDIATIGNSIGLNIIERISTKNTKFDDQINYIRSVEEYKQNYFYPIILDKLSIKLYGDNGFILDNNGSDNSFEFELTMMNSNNDM